MGNLKSIDFERCTSGIEFEGWVCDLLRKLSFPAERVGKNDSGVDIIARARALILFTVSTIVLRGKNFEFVPKQDWSKKWTDTDLYQKYDLSDNEIALVEYIIAPMV